MSYALNIKAYKPEEGVRQPIQPGFMWAAAITEEFLLKFNMQNAVNCQKRHILTAAVARARGVFMGSGKHSRSQQHYILVKKRYSLPLAISGVTRLDRLVLLDCKLLDWRS